MASCTVAIFSAASSGISTLKASSKAITNSTVSRLSAPRSSMNEASGVTLASSTPRCSTTICLILSATSLIGRLSPCLGLSVAGLDVLASPVDRVALLSVRLARFDPGANRGWVAGPNSQHGHATIDVQCRAGDPGGCIGRQVNHGAGDIV